MVGLTLRTAAFKHDLVNLSDNMENRQAEVTADAKQIVTLNQVCNGGHPLCQACCLM